MKFPIQIQLLVSLSCAALVMHLEECDGTSIDPFKAKFAETLTKTYDDDANTECPKVTENQPFPSCYKLLQPMISTIDAEKFVLETDKLASALFHYIYSAKRPALIDVLTNFCKILNKWTKCIRKTITNCKFAESSARAKIKNFVAKITLESFVGVFCDAARPQHLSKGVSYMLEEGEEITGCFAAEQGKHLKNVLFQKSGNIQKHLKELRERKSIANRILEKLQLRMCTNLRSLVNELLLIFRRKLDDDEDLCVTFDKYLIYTSVQILLPIEIQKSCSPKVVTEPKDEEYLDAAGQESRASVSISGSFYQSFAGYINHEISVCKALSFDPKLPIVLYEYDLVYISGVIGSTRSKRPIIKKIRIDFRAIDEDMEILTPLFHLDLPDATSKTAFTPEFQVVDEAGVNTETTRFYDKRESKRNTIIIHLNWYSILIKDAASGLAMVITRGYGQYNIYVRAPKTALELGSGRLVAACTHILNDVKPDSYEKSNIEWYSNYLSQFDESLQKLNVQYETNPPPANPTTIPVSTLPPLTTRPITTRPITTRPITTQPITTRAHITSKLSTARQARTTAIKARTTRAPHKSTQKIPESPIETTGEMATSDAQLNGRDSTLNTESDRPLKESLTTLQVTSKDAQQRSSKTATPLSRATEKEMQPASKRAPDLSVQILGDYSEHDYLEVGWDEELVEKLRPTAQPNRRDDAAIHAHPNVQSIRRNVHRKFAHRMSHRKVWRIAVFSVLCVLAIIHGVCG